MKKRTLRTLIAKKLLLVVIASALFTCNHFEGELHEIPLFSEKFWGEWIRMDTGETWYFASNYRMVGNSYYTDRVNMEMQSRNVIKVTEGTGESAKRYFLYASRIRNSKFEASAVKDEVLKSLFSRFVNVPHGSKAVVQAIKNRKDKQTVEIGDNGELEVENIIVGDDYSVTIDGYEFIVTPNTDYDNVGTFTLTPEVNIKTSIVPQLPYTTDMMRLFSGISYDLTIKFTNIGDTVSPSMVYRLTLPPKLKITSNTNSPLLTSGNLQSFNPKGMQGDTQNVDVTIWCEQISNEFEFKDIIIETEIINGKKWNDSVSLKINREWVTFNIKSKLEVNCVVIIPTGKAYYFKTSKSGNLYSAELVVPKNYQKYYYIVFSGALATTETIYSFAIDKVPNANLNDYLITDPELTQSGGTEQTSAEIDYNKEVIAYLEMNKANYYKVKFTDNP